MAELADIREAIRAKLSVIDGVQVAAYKPGNPIYPSLFVLGPDEVGYHEAMHNGLIGWRLSVMALVGANLDEVKFRQLDAMLASSGTSSVRELLEADPTLNGVASFVVVRRASGYRTYAFDQLVWGCDWTVEVGTAG